MALSRGFRSLAFLLPAIQATRRLALALLLEHAQQLGLQFERDADLVEEQRSWAERVYNVKRLTEMPAGGHFAAIEEPAALAAEIRAFFRDLGIGPARMPVLDGLR
jgi:pimeloyl-ACP methyl ester carboxylesterase